jgi:hypothetical protein
MLHPVRAAAFASGTFLVVAALSLLLGIGIRFQANKQTITGFLLSHWGPTFLLATPLSAFLMGWYFRALDNAILSLDRILKPEQTDSPPFSECIADRFRYAWPAYIYPVCLFLPMLLTLIADGRDIISPLQSPVIPPSHEKDWSTLGYLATNAWHPLWYLIFNIAAFALQVFIAYCGFLLLLLTAYLLGLSITYGLAGKPLKELFVPPDTARSVQFKAIWDFTAPKGRCGLHMLDTVFFLYVALNFVCLGVTIVSVVVNERWKGGVDLGSVILMVGTLLFIPLSFIWILLPYYSNFPDELPAELKDKGFPKPTAWPWGSEKLTWGLIGLAITSWVYIASKAIAFLGF